MKKLTLVVGLLLLAAFVFADEEAIKSVSPAKYSDLLPAETLVVVSIPHIEELKALIASPEVQGALTTTGLTEKALMFLKEADAEFSAKAQMSLFDMYDDLGGGATFALTGLDIANKDASFAILIGMKGGSAMVESYLDRLVEAGKEREKEINYVDAGGVKMLSMDGEAFIGSWADSLVLVNKIEVMEALVSKSPRLSQNPYFKLNEKHTGLASGLLAYINLEAIYKVLAPEITKSKEGFLAVRLLGLDRLLSASFVFPLSDNQLAKVLIHAPAYTGVIPMIFSSKGVGQHAATATADNADLLSAISINKPLQIYESFLKLMPQINPAFDRAAYDAQVGTMEESMGISIVDDILAPFGEYIAFSFYLEMMEDDNIDLKNDPTALLKLMNMELAFKLDDQDKFIQTMDTLILMAGGAVTPETYKDAIIYAIAAPGMPFQASLCVYNNQLKFGMYPPEKAKMIIDKVLAGQTMSAFNDYKKTVKPVPANSNTYTFQSRNYIAKWSGFGATFGMALSAEDKEAVKHLMERSKEISKTFPDLYSYSVVIPEGLYGESKYPTKKAIEYVIIELMKYEKYFGVEKFKHDLDGAIPPNDVDKMTDPG